MELVGKGLIGETVYVYYSRLVQESTTVGKNNNNNKIIPRQRKMKRNQIN